MYNERTLSHRYVSATLEKLLLQIQFSWRPLCWNMIDVTHWVYFDWSVKYWIIVGLWLAYNLATIMTNEQCFKVTD